jgi:serine phosphatase RsbU (regulator of sigma subunit)
MALVLIVALDWFILDQLTVEPALTSAPALAAVVSRRVWYPILTGGVTLLAAFVLAACNGALADSVHTPSALTIVLVALIAWAGAVIRARQEKALADARLVAEIAQRVLLRPVPGRIAGVLAAVRYASASGQARIGGDLYEVVNTRHGVRAVVGDVRGKGLEAVETAAAVLGAFREAAHQEPRLELVARWLAGSLERSLEETGQQGTEEEFVTLVLIGIRPDGVTEIVNCGHPAPVLVRGGERPRLLEPNLTVPPLGVLPAASVRPPVALTTLLPGDRVLLYTDGVIEARNRTGLFYPLLERLPGCASAEDPSEVLARLHGDVVRHVGRRLGDDAAMLLLQYEPVAPSEPPPRPDGRVPRYSLG